MAEYTTNNQIECWKILGKYLDYGHTIPYLLKDRPARYILTSDSYGWGPDFHVEAPAEHLLTSIEHALFVEKVDTVKLRLYGKLDGHDTEKETYLVLRELRSNPRLRPEKTMDWAEFTFSRNGLVKAHIYFKAHSYYFGL